jgi:branched-chain amino acid transport system substrate-binding protein
LFRTAFLSLVGGASLLAVSMQPSIGQSNEIRLGQTFPYSGPLSAWGQIGRAYGAYIDKINAEGGINGRTIKLISLDDGYSPPKTAELTRRLVERDEVRAMVGSLGSAPQIAVQKYLNDHRVPQLFIYSGVSHWNNPKQFPWSIGLTPNYATEGRIYARHLITEKPDAKAAILYQNDDLGREYASAFRDELTRNGRAKVVAEASYDTTDPTIDSQIIALKASGADVLLIAAGSKHTSLAIRKVYDLDWHPLRFVISPSNSIASVLAPAGLDKADGVISASYYKDPNDPQWQNDQGYKDWLAWMKTYNPRGDVADSYNVHGYNGGYLLVELLRRCGHDFSRENIMRQAANLRDLRLPMFLPGIAINTTPDDLRPIKQLMLLKFDGKRWQTSGSVIDG